MKIEVERGRLGIERFFVRDIKPVDVAAFAVNLADFYSQMPFHRTKQENPFGFSRGVYFTVTQRDHLQGARKGEAYYAVIVNNPKMEPRDINFVVPEKNNRARIELCVCDGVEEVHDFTQLLAKHLISYAQLHSGKYKPRYERKAA